MVLLTEDARLSNSPTGVTKDFSALSQRSTEYHFPSFEQQVEAIKRDHLQPGWWITFFLLFELKVVVSY